MTPAGEDATGSTLDDRSIEDSVEAIAPREDVESDPDRIRVALERVSTDGVVSYDAAGDELAYVSKVVSTPETRVELARMAFEDARETAEPHRDVPTVAVRLEAFESDLEGIEDAVADLGRDLQAIVERQRDGGDLYEIGRRIVELDHTAGQLQGRADELASDLEGFERWLTDPAARAAEFEVDLGAIEESLDGLAAVRRRLEESSEGMDDPAVRWAEATARQRMVELLVTDVQAELADLETLADRTGETDDRSGEDAPDLAELGGRVQTQTSRVETLGTDLDEAAQADWRRRFEDEIVAVEADLADHEPPVPWGSVQATMETHLEAIACER